MQKTFEEKSSLGVVLGLLAAERGLRHAFATKNYDEKRLSQRWVRKGFQYLVHQIHGDGDIGWISLREIGLRQKNSQGEGADGYDATCESARVSWRSEPDRSGPIFDPAPYYRGDSCWLWGTLRGLS
jgi:hypothetical protein